MKNQRVLLVEDEDDARELLVLGLNKFGYACAGVATVRAALDRLEAGWDAVVLDLRLPDGNGIDLLTALRAGRVPCLCIIVSSFADKAAAIAALNSGADYLLEKPFGVATLHELLQLLESRRDTDLRRRLAAYTMLTEREQTLVQYVLKGIPNEELARLAGITLQSAKNALSRIYAKLGVASRHELFHLFLAEP